MGRIQKGIALLDFFLIPFLVFPDLAINFFRVSRVISKSVPELFARQPVIGFLKSFQVFVNAVKCGNYFPDLDEVEGLGSFLELEVVLQEGQRAKDGMTIANKLMEKLGVKKKDLITSAYIDLIKKRY